MRDTDLMLLNDIKDLGVWRSGVDIIDPEKKRAVVERVRALMLELEQLRAELARVKGQP